MRSIVLSDPHRSRSDAGFFVQQRALVHFRFG